MQSFARAVLLSAAAAATCVYMPVFAVDRDAVDNADEQLPKKYFESFESGDYRLGVGDAVKIYVVGFPDTMRAALPVAPDGRIYYLLAGGVPADGQLPQEVAEEIRSRIGHLFSEPQVVVLPQKLASSRYYVYGKVDKPGIYDLNQPMSVREAVARAGGLAQGIYRGSTVDIFSLEQSYLLRKGKKVPIDFKQLLQGFNSNANDIFIRAGDIIHIASGLGKNSEIYLLGEVMEQKPVAYTDGITLMDVIAGSSERGGGLTRDAYTKQILILRGSLADPETFQVNLDDVLHGRARNIYMMPGDIVYVPQKPFQFVRALARQVVNTFVETFASEFGGAWMEDTFFPKNPVSEATTNQ